MAAALRIGSITAAGRNDNSIRFSNGAMQVSFNIAQGQTAATFVNAPGLTILTGTTAGVITLTTTLSWGGAALTPPPVRRITVAAGPPVLTGMQLQQITGGISVTWSGYSLTGQLGSCLFHFAAATGSTLQTSDFTAPLTSPFAAWMGN